MHVAGSVGTNVISARIIISSFLYSVKHMLQIAPEIFLFD